VVANADITGETLEIFSLKIGFIQSDLVALGRFAVALLLWVFLLHTMTQLFSRVSALAKGWFSRWEQSARNETHEIENRHYQEGDGREPEIWEIWFGEQSEKKSRIVSFFVTSEILFEAMKEGLLKYLVVIVLSICALWWPQSLLDVLEFFRIAKETPVELPPPLGGK
jgi:hypothetical protein